MVSISFLPSQRKLVDSPYFLRRGNHKRDEDGYLSASGHIRVLFAFFRARTLLALVQSEDLTAATLRHAKSGSLLVEDNTQEGIVDLDLAVVSDEAQFSEFVHEQIDSRPRCTNHLCQHLLRYFGKHLLRLARRAITREQQQSARQPFLGGVEQLVYQVLLDSRMLRASV
jgi:hypothetical protein